MNFLLLKPMLNFYFLNRKLKRVISFCLPQKRQLLPLKKRRIVVYLLLDVILVFVLHSCCPKICLFLSFLGDHKFFVLIFFHQLQTRNEATGFGAGGRKKIASTKKGKQKTTLKVFTIVFFFG